MNRVEAEHYTLSKLADNDELPFALLLLADETKEAIEKYIYQSDVYVLQVKDHKEIVGVFAIHKIDDTGIEIKNIAVTETHRNLGIGSFLLDKIKKIGIQHNSKEIIVGTSNCGELEIKFYQKNGFDIYAKRPNFFIENYALPIVENGCVLNDMIMLRYLL